MRDGAVRRVVKRLARWRYGCDLAITRWIRRLRKEAPELELAGHCNGCGACCETPMIYLNRWLFYARSVRWAVLGWHRWINGFEYLGEDRSQHAFIFRCTHYDTLTGQCDSYESRPGMCRDYPRNLLDSPAPEFLTPCSFYPRARNADEIVASLRDLNLPPERLAELEIKFYVAPPLHLVPDRNGDDDGPTPPTNLRPPTAA